MKLTETNEIQYNIDGLFGFAVRPPEKLYVITLSQ